MIAFWVALVLLGLVVTFPVWWGWIVDAWEQHELDNYGDHSDDCVDDPDWDKRRWW